MPVGPLLAHAARFMVLYLNQYSFFPAKRPHAAESAKPPVPNSLVPESCPGPVAFFRFVFEFLHVPLWPSSGVDSRRSRLGYQQLRR